MLKKVFLISLMATPSLYAEHYSDMLEEYKAAYRTFSEKYIIGEYADKVDQNQVTRINNMLIEKIKQKRNKINNGYTKFQQSEKMGAEYIPNKIKFWIEVRHFFKTNEIDTEISVVKGVNEKFKKVDNALDQLFKSCSNYQAYVYKDPDNSEEIGSKFSFPNASFDEFSNVKNTVFLPILQHTISEVSIKSVLKNVQSSLSEIEKSVNYKFDLAEFALKRENKWLKRLGEQQGFCLGVKPEDKSAKDSKNEVVE